MDAGDERRNGAGGLQGRDSYPILTRASVGLACCGAGGKTADGNLEGL